MEELGIRVTDDGFTRIDPAASLGPRQTPTSGLNSSAAGADRSNATPAPATAAVRKKSRRDHICCWFMFVSVCVFRLN